MELLADYALGHAPNLATILRQGWSPPEPDFAWSMAATATLDMPLPPGDGIVFVELALHPFTSGIALERQRLEINVNGIALPPRTLAWACVLRLELPREATHGRTTLAVTLDMADATAPSVLGLSADARRLGIALSGVKLLRARARDAPPPPAGPGRMAEFRFGANEATAPMLIEGWDAPESDYVWAIARRSTVRVPITPGAGPRTDGVCVLIDIKPYLPTPQSKARIVIGADNRLLGFVSVADRTCLGFTLPEALRGAPSVTLSFDHLDVPDAAWSPGDETRRLAFMLCSVRVCHRPEPVTAAAVLAPSGADRRAPLAGRIDDGSLAAAVRAATGEDPQVIVRGFMGLGWSCELATLQRRLGWDYAGLFRFAGIWTFGLIEGLSHGFRGLGRPDTLSLKVRQDHDRGYWMVDSAYGLSVQTAISSLTVDEAALKRQLGRTLPLLARKFFEDLAAAERICVYQRRDAVSEPEVVAVVAALSVWGDLTVLWVVTDNARAGEAERLGPRLLRGFVDDHAPWDQGSDVSWLSVLANAWTIAGTGGSSSS